MQAAPERAAGQAPAALGAQREPREVAEAPEERPAFRQPAAAGEESDVRPRGLPAAPEPRESLPPALLVLPPRWPPALRAGCIQQLAPIHPQARSRELPLPRFLRSRARAPKPVCQNACEPGQPRPRRSSWNASSSRSRPATAVVRSPCWRAPRPLAPARLFESSS